MKWILYAVAVLAAVCLSLPAADAQGCANGQCFAAGPVMAGPYYGGPVILRPVPDPMFSPVQPLPVVFVEADGSQFGNHESHSPGHHSPPIVFACGSGQCQPRQYDCGNAWQRQRTCGVGINLTWHRSGGNQYQSRWR